MRTTWINSTDLGNAIIWTPKSSPERSRRCRLFRLGSICRQRRGAQTCWGLKGGYVGFLERGKGVRNHRVRPSPHSVWISSVSANRYRMSGHAQGIGLTKGATARVMDEKLEGWANVNDTGE